MAKQQICPILGRETISDETDFCRDSWSIVRCRETGFVFLNNPPDYAQLENELAWEKTSSLETERREADEPVMSYVHSFVKKAKVAINPTRNRIAGIACGILRGMPGDQPLRVLDIGCAWGDNLAAIYQRCAGFGRTVVPYGIEISRYLAGESQARVSPVGGTVICASAVDGVAQLERETIDLALLSSLLEHEYQPLQLLQGLNAVLAPGGAVAIKVPNFASWNRLIRGRRWCGFRFPDHVNYFTPKTLQRLAEEAGFTVARQNVLDRFPLSDSMYAVLTKNA